MSTVVWPGILITWLIINSSLSTAQETTKLQFEMTHISNEELKHSAFQILDTKCNVCHRKQNPFMLFKESNMTKKAKKIYQVVFIEQRMPKGKDVRLSKHEYLILKKWLKTQKIN
jgi:uncharacterized membrane protein